MTLTLRMGTLSLEPKQRSRQGLGVQVWNHGETETGEL